jgi:hypothetical protein
MQVGNDSSVLLTSYGEFSRQRNREANLRVSSAPPHPFGTAPQKPRRRYSVHRTTRGVLPHPACAPHARVSSQRFTRYTPITPSRTTVGPRGTPPPSLFWGSVPPRGLCPTRGLPPSGRFAVPGSHHRPPHQDPLSQPTTVALLCSAPF